jgi:hypothetical protein
MENGALRIVSQVGVVEMHVQEAEWRNGDED